MDWLRWRRKAEQAATRYEYETDARRERPSAGPEGPGPRGFNLRRTGRVLALVAVFLAGSVAALLGEGGLKDMRGLQREVAARRAAVEEARQRVREVEREVGRLRSDPLARERIAREELGLVMPGEIDFLLPKEEEDRP